MQDERQGAIKMKMMHLAEVNKMVADRCGQGTPHNIGIKSQAKIEAAGHEMKVNPPKILAKTQKKFGKKRMEKQKVAIMLSKAREAGAKIPKS